MRKIASAFIASPAATSRLPSVDTQAILPRRATSMTAPGTRPESTCFCVTSSRRFNWADERPTSSGLPAMGSTPFSACAAVAADTRASASIVFFMGALPEKGVPLWHSLSATPLQIGAVTLEELDQRVHDRPHPWQGPEVAMDQEPLLGRDLGQHAADAAQLRVLVREIARQHGKPGSDARRLMQDEPVVDPDLGPPAQLLVQPALARHVAVVVVEADPGLVDQRRHAGVLELELARRIDRVGDMAELAGDDAGKLGYLLADQEIGLAPRQVGERVALDDLEFDLLQPGPQPRQMARDQHSHRLAGRQAHHATHRVA